METHEQVLVPRPFCELCGLFCAFALPSVFSSRCVAYVMAIESIWGTSRVPCFPVYGYQTQVFHDFHEVVHEA